MAGTDAAAGFAYQHAQAIRWALDLMDSDESEYLRVEAANDVVDAEIYDRNDRLLRAAQFKRRDSKYTWGEAELAAELVRWSTLSASHPEARYEFVTDGRLGPSGRGVQRALNAARSGDTTPIVAIATRTAKALDVAACARATVIADTPGFDALVIDSTVRSQALLPHVSGTVEGEERANQVVLELLRRVVARSGDSDPDARVLTKSEVAELLSARPEYVTTSTWNTTLTRKFTESAASRVNPAFPLRCRPTDSASILMATTPGGAQRLEDLIALDQVVLLSGPTGSGKSTVLQLAQSTVGQRGQVFIVVDAEEYVENRLGSLVARGINAVQFLGAYSSTGISALSDPTVTIVIDGVSEIPQASRDALKEELRQVLSSDLHAAIALAGRDAAILRSLLPRHIAVNHVHVEPLGKDDRRQLLNNGLRGRLSTDTVNRIVARVERALGDAAANPQLFIMGAQLIAAGHEPTNPASMYSQYVRAEAERNGYPEISTSEAGLGIAFAELAASERRYCDSFEWTEHLSAAAVRLSDAGHTTSVGDLRTFGFESGLVFRSSGDTIRAIHDSFADYFAAVAYRRRLVDLPTSLSADCTTRIKFLAELDGVDNNLATRVSTDLPFQSAAISRHECARPHPNWYDQTRALLSAFWPEDTDIPAIAFWNDDTGRLIATVGGNTHGWIGPSSIDEMGTHGYTFVAENGPLHIATRIWKRQLSDLLKTPSPRATPLPRTSTETETTLAAYSDALADRIAALAQQLSPSGHRDTLLQAIGPHRIQFLLHEKTDSADQRERPVSYRFVDDIKPNEIVLDRTMEPDDAWSGSGRVDSFLLRDHIDSAANIISDAINALSGERWL